MIHYSKILAIADIDKKPHNYKFVTKGDEKSNRRGGYIGEMKNSIVTSNNKNITVNLKSLTSGEIRKVYLMLVTEFDGVEVIL